MKYNFIGIVLALWASPLVGQDVLTKSEAVKIALENNYAIQIADNNTEIAKNNASRKNGGYLPTLTGSAGVNYVNQSTTTGILDSMDNVIDRTNPGGNTYSYNTSVNLNYVIFDGQGRQYNYQKLQESHQISQLQARQIIENELVNLFTIYYEIARLTREKLIQQESLSISKHRMKRTIYAFEYGQNSKLDMLNAEVDYNNDSIQYLNLSQQLDNMKRDLNLFLGRDVNINFAVDTLVIFEEGLSLDSVLSEAKTKNAQILQNRHRINQSEYDINVIRANLIPQISFRASYNWNGTDFDTNANPFGFQYQNVRGPQAGFSLTWNIFDGGITHVKLQNSRIHLKNEELSFEQNQKQLERNIRNAWSTYQTSRFILKAEEKNLETSELNFQRTEEEYKLGQVGSIEFRQAQANRLFAYQNLYRAQFDAKVAEIILLQLSGDLMRATF